MSPLRRQGQARLGSPGGEGDGRRTHYRRPMAVETCPSCSESYVEGGELWRLELEAARGLLQAGFVSGTSFSYARYAIRMTCEGLARELGVEPETLADWESGARPIGRLAVSTVGAIVAEELARKVQMHERLPLRDVRPSHVRGILDKAVAQGLKRATVAHVRGALRRLFAEALAEELVETNPVVAVRSTDPENARSPTRSRDPEPGLRRCPGHQLHGHAAPWTAYATDLVAEPQAHPRHVQMPPATPLVGVVDRANAFEAPRAERHAGGRRDVEQHPLGLQVDREDARLLQREDPREYRGDAHGGTGLLCWLGSCKVAPPPCALSSPPRNPRRPTIPRQSGRATHRRPRPRFHQTWGRAQLNPSRSGQRCTRSNARGWSKSISPGKASRMRGSWTHSGALRARTSCRPSSRSSR